MEEFGAIEDDYVNFHKKSNNIKQNYDALRCEPAWFLSSGAVNKECITLKYKADYFFLKEKYSEAIDLYKIYMNDYTNSPTVKKECLEGICRSYLALHCYCFALNYAHKLHTLSVTFDSHTASISLLYDCYFTAQRFKDAVIYGKKLVLLHCSNSDAWLKLSIAFSKHFKVSLLYVLPKQRDKLHNTDSVCNVKDFSLNCTCETSDDRDQYDTVKNGISHIIASLLYTEFHLKSIMNSSLGFALTQNLELQEKINKEIQRLCSNKDYIDHVRENIKMLLTRGKSDKEISNAEFIDRSSSKFANAEETTCALEEFSEKEFEEKWFTFI